MLFLRQSTAVDVHVGPLVDATDGWTPETAIALATGEADLYKHAATAQVDIAARSWAHIAKGVYRLSLTAADTDTLGHFAVVITDSAHRPFRLQGVVMPQQRWDSLFGTDLLQVDAREINGVLTSGMVQSISGVDTLRANVCALNGSIPAAESQAGAALAIVRGTALAGSTTTQIVTDLTEATNDHYNGRSLIFVGSTLAGQAATIVDYAGATKTMTVPALTEAPIAGTEFVIV